MAKQNNIISAKQFSNSCVRTISNQKFDETTLVTSWERTVGKSIANEPKKFCPEKFFSLSLDSPAMKNDLNYHQSQISLSSKRVGKE